MRILYWQWHSFMGKGVEAAFQKLNISYHTFFYQLSDWEQDEQFQTSLEKMLAEKFDAVFSINYTPLIAAVCEQKQIPYLSWTYDSPIHIRNLESLKSKWNHAYFFDRGMVEDLRKQGMPARHLPLAANPAIFTPMIGDQRECSTQIAMVGNLYQNDYQHYLSPLDGYLRGYLEGIISSQLKIYGGYLLPELVTEELLAKLNAAYQAASGGKVTIAARELEYLLAQEVTGRERYLALKLLSERFETNVYSNQRDERLTAVNWKGYADYYTKMPAIFAGSDINLNISLKTIQTGIPLRILDVLACGGFLISNYQIELSEHFQLGEELVVYHDLEELVYLCEYYLEHEAERQQIAKRGRRRIETDFRFEDKLQKILNEL